MNPIETVLRKIQMEPGKPSTNVLCELLTALDTGKPFHFTDMYALLDYKDFTLALEVIRAWRLEEMRVTKGQLSSVVARPESCFAQWVAFREADFGLLGT